MTTEGTSAETAFTTPATEWLDARGAQYTRARADPQALVGRESLCACLARQLDAPVECTLKTLIFEDARAPDTPPVALVLPGTHTVDKARLAAAVGVPAGHTLRLCRPERAHEFTGYVFGGTSPFGLRRADAVRVFVDEAVRTTAARHTPHNVWINGGGPGLVARMDVDELFRILLADGAHVVAGAALPSDK